MQAQPERPNSKTCCHWICKELGFGQILHKFLFVHIRSGLPDNLNYKKSNERLCQLSFLKKDFFAWGWWGDFTKKSCNLMQTKQGLKVLVSSVPFTLSVVLLHVSKVDKHPPIYRAVLNTFSGWHGRNFWSKLASAFNY